MTAIWYCSGITYVFWGFVVCHWFYPYPGKNWFLVPQCTQALLWALNKWPHSPHFHFSLSCFINLSNPISSIAWRFSIGLSPYHFFQGSFLCCRQYNGMVYCQCCYIPRMYFLTSGRQGIGHILLHMVQCLCYLCLLSFSWLILLVIVMVFEMLPSVCGWCCVVR